MKVITLPNGQPVTIAEYVRSWKKLRTLPPNADVAHWSWFPVQAAEILRQISRGVHDRINRHLPNYRYEPHQRHATQKLEKLVRIGLLQCECRWCGSPLKTYHRREFRFCDGRCRRDYYH